MGLLAGISWKQAKVPAIPQWLGGAMVTNDWCITPSHQQVQEKKYGAYLMILDDNSKIIFVKSS